MIKQFSVGTLLDLGRKINEMGIDKEQLIQIVYTGDERMVWVCFYSTDK